MRLFILIFFALFQCSAFSQAYESFNEKRLPVGMKFKGDFLNGITYNDKAGKNFIVISEINHKDDFKNDIFVVHFIKKGATIIKNWDIQDFGKPLCKLEVDMNTFQVIDLDQDGFMESSFFYAFECDGLDPTIVKSMLHTKSTKLAIRGQKPHQKGDEYQKNFDAAFDKQMDLFKNFASAEWEEFMNEKKDAFFFKTIHTELPGALLIYKEHMVASGHYEYELWKKDCTPFVLDEKIGAKIKNAFEITFLEQQNCLFIADIPEIGCFSFSDNKYHRLMSFFEDTEALSPLSVSPDGSKVGIVALNMNQYPESTKIFILTIDKDKLVAKKKIDAAIFHTAGSAWIIEPIEFVADDEIEYTKVTTFEEVENNIPPKTKRVKIN